MVGSVATPTATRHVWVQSRRDVVAPRLAARDPRVPRLAGAAATCVAAYALPPAGPIPASSPCRATSTARSSRRSARCPARGQARAARPGGRVPARGKRVGRAPRRPRRRGEGCRALWLLSAAALLRALRPRGTA
jgi:hypothetical protein